MVDKVVLKELVEVLNREHITWGIGGSYLLKIHDLIDNPNDLDLWVSQDDMIQLRNRFRNYQELKTNVPLPPELHYKILYNNVEVDFVACFKIRPNQYSFEYNISPNNIKMIKLPDGIEVPCTYLEDWYIVYKLLKRNEKARIIENFFMKNKLTLSNGVINESMDLSVLPKYIKREVNEFVNNVLQLSFFD